MKALILQLATLIAASIPSSASGGVVLASVFDHAGRHIEGALVRADRLDSGMTLSVVPECLTDSSGRCSLDNLPPGRYTVNAGKQQDGYPNMYIPFYRRGEPAKTIEVKAQTKPVNVSIVLGPKGAWVHLSVVDAATGKRIENPTIILRRALSPDDFLSTNLGLNSEILLPSDDDVLMEVKAPGYRMWHLVESSGISSDKPLRLHPGETRQLSIRLNRE